MGQKANETNETNENENENGAAPDFEALLNKSLEKFANHFTKTFDAQKAEIEGLKQTLVGLKSSNGSSDKPGKADKPPGDKDEDGKVTQEQLDLRRHQREIQALRAEIDKAKAESAQTAATAKAERLNRMAMDAISKVYPGETAKNVMARLQYEKLIDLEGDEPRMKVKTDYGVSELLPISKGLAEFKSSDVGKTFLPPEPVAGSGGTAGRSAGGVKDARPLVERLRGRLSGTD